MAQDKLETQPLLVDVTGVDPSINAEMFAASTSTTSSTMGRRVAAATELNKTIDFGETHRPEDLDDDWCYVSSKNAEKRVVHATTDVDTFIHLLKGNIGTGLLALPMATQDAGYILGFIGIFVIGLVATHCMILLVESANALCEWNEIQALDYSETMQFAIKESGAHKIVAKISKFVVNIFLLITQFGFCSVYFVFIGETLQQVMEEAFCISLDKKAWIAVMIIPLIVFNWIRNLDNLASLSMLANVCILFGLAVIFSDVIYHFVIDGDKEAAIKKSDHDVKPFGSALSLALFFGNVVYAYEGIGVVLPLENKMKTPHHAKYVIYGAMVSITILYAFFGLLGYLTYGSNVHANVVLNLCAFNAGSSFVFLLTKLLFAYSVFSSYLLQFYVPMDFLEPPFYKYIKLDYVTYRYPKYHNVIKTAIQLGFRTGLVLLTAALALGIPDLGDLITLVGALASSALALVFPALIHILTFWKQPNKKCLGYLPKPFWIVKDVAIISLGVIGFLFGTFASFNSIIKYFEHHPTDIICTDPEFQTSCHLVPNP